MAVVVLLDVGLVMAVVVLVARGDDKTYTVTSTFTATTTSVTPYDSSSGNSANALQSSNSGSLNTGALASDSSNSMQTSQSNQSGSSGSYLPIWQWCVGLSLLCCCLSLLSSWAMMRSKPPRKRKVTAKPEKKPVPVETLSPGVYMPPQQPADA